jgi:AcrR family transcriptional regulator
MVKKRNVEKVDISNSDNTRSQDKIEAILQGAMQEFLTHGFAATSMDRVTAAAGVSKATVYSYFQDKETLFIALIERLIATCTDMLNQQNPTIFQGEPREVLAGLANNFLNELSQNVSNQPELLDLIRLMIAESGRFPMLAQHMVRSRDKRFVQVVTQYLQSHPELQLIDAEATTRIFMGTLVHFVMIEYMLQAGEILPIERQRLVNCLVDLITCRQITDTDKENYLPIKDKTSRRKRSTSGKFQRDYAEPKRLRSIRLTDTAWENLDEIAKKSNLTRTELIELFARGETDSTL